MNNPTLMKVLTVLIVCAGVLSMYADASMCLTSKEPANVPTSRFIATAAFGTDLEERLEPLRKLKDDILMASSPGRFLVLAYCAASLPATNLIAKHETLRTAVRLALMPVVFTVEHPLYSVLIFFMAIAAFILVIKMIKPDTVPIETRQTGEDIE